MEKKKIIDPVTGKEIWVIVDENGTIIESNVTPPEDVLDNEAKKKLKEQEIERLKAELDTVKKAYVMDTEDLKKNMENLAAMVAKLTEANSVAKINQEANNVLNPQEKIVYVENPETAAINKNLIDKVTQLSKFKEEAEHEKFINAQLKAKPYLADLVKTLGVRTQEDYVKFIMPLEEREEENARIREQLKNNQTRDMVSEYGITRADRVTSAEEKILKESEEEAFSLFSRLII